MSHPTTRVLAMLELMQAHHRMSGPDLAARLGVDERTVRRYAGRLAELGIPVTAERGRYGGYRLMPGYKLPPLMFDDDEATAVVLGLLAGRRLGLPGEAAGTALAKVQRVLPGPLRDRVRALQETLGFTSVSREGEAPAAETVLTLAQAARERRRVLMRYRSWKGIDSERELDPYGLVLHSGRWYFAGHDHHSGETRTFRADRVLSVELGTVRFDVLGDVDPVEHVVRSLSAVPYAHEVEVELETTLREAARRIPPSAAALSETGSGVLLSARAESLDGMAQMLAGLGWPFTIRRPDELRGAVRDLAARLAERADA